MANTREKLVLGSNCSIYCSQPQMPHVNVASQQNSSPKWKAHPQEMQAKQVRHVAHTNSLPLANIIPYKIRWNIQQLGILASRIQFLKFQALNIKEISIIRQQQSINWRATQTQYLIYFFNNSLLIIQLQKTTEAKLLIHFSCFLFTPVLEMIQNCLVTIDTKTWPLLHMQLLMAHIQGANIFGNVS